MNSTHVDPEVLERGGVRLEENGLVATITLNRPATKNSQTPSTWMALRAIGAALDPASREEVLAAIRSYEGAIILVTHDEGAVAALEPDRVLILPDGVEDLWGDDYRDLVELA